MSYGEKARRDDLHGEWNDPLLISRFDVQCDAVVYEKPYDGADLPATFVKTDKPASNCRWSNLSDVNGLSKRCIMS